jgi:Flp pilus assembly pilin Flp
MKFLRDIKGQGLIEWLTAAIIIIAVVGGVLLAIANSLKNRLEAVNNEL